MEDELSFDFEQGLERNLLTHKDVDLRLMDIPAEEIGQQPGNFKKNFRQTVCTYWLRGLCMKGDACGFLHQYDQDRMPVCRTLIKTGICKELDCPYKHDLEEIKECNMFKLGFCIYGPQCRYKHKRQAGPPPDPSTVEAAKPKDYRDINRVVNSVNPGVVKEEERMHKRPRPFYGRGRDGDRSGPRDRDRDREPMLLLPAPAPPPGDPPSKPSQQGGAETGGASRGSGLPMGTDMPPLTGSIGGMGMPSIHGMAGMNMPMGMPGMMGPPGMMNPNLMDPNLLAAFARQFNFPMPDFHTMR